MAATAAVSPARRKQHMTNQNGHHSSSPATAATDRSQQKIDQMFIKTAVQARANGDHLDHDNTDEEEADYNGLANARDDDRGEGTSANGAHLMAKMGAAISGHLDIATLLKEPLVFVQAKHADEASQKLPYDPLPSGPSAVITPNGVGKGKGPLLNGAADGQAGPASTSNTTSTSVNSSMLLNSATSTSTNLSNSTSVATTHTIPLPTSWPQHYPAGPGYHNLGNTCFLNSVLQSLTHTAPLVACLIGESYHNGKQCKLAQRDKFCLLCAMQRHVRSCFGKNKSSAMAPKEIVGRLSAFAKGMRVGRQEDAHEFLRFFLDGMQISACLNTTPVAKTEQAKESTFLYRIFGGKLRSRVTCMSCKHNSDTFDSFMDLSLDVANAISLKDAFQSFVKVDMLQGSNKYKCEKCKKLVTARKQFTINKAPQILHIHLKRFTPTGRKINGNIAYPQELSLGPYMSAEANDNPLYRLYAVVCHSGSGPHSGHYFANVRAGNGKWYQMNDSSVNEVAANGAANQRNAYLLFYERTNRLGDSTSTGLKIPGQFPGAVGQDTKSSPASAQVNGKRKERDHDDDEIAEEKTAFPHQRIRTNSTGASHQSNGMHSPAASSSSSPATASSKHPNHQNRAGPASPQNRLTQQQLQVNKTAQNHQSLLQRGRQPVSAIKGRNFFGSQSNHRSQNGMNNRKNMPKLVSSMQSRRH